MHPQFLLFPLFAGLIGWQLWMARTRGELSVRGGVVRSADRPILFRTAVAIYLVTLVALTVYGALSASRIVSPAQLSSRMSDHYPTAARAQRIEGHAVLRCRVTPTYGLKDCQVASETPPSYGFGPAAIQVATLMTLPPSERATAHPGQFINLPIAFKLPDEDR